MKKLQEIRRKNKLSQSNLSKLSGVSFRTIQKYERGELSIDGAKLKKLSIKEK